MTKFKPILYSLKGSNGTNANLYKKRFFDNAVIILMVVEKNEN